MKAGIAKDTLMTHADHNKPHKIETDASDCQLGGQISQMHFDPEQGKEVERDVAFCTRKLNSAQKNCAAVEKELLSIVEILKEFCSTLFGADIEMYTDHMNLTCKLSQHDKLSGGSSGQ
jgi:hypothetical protein